MAHAGVTPTDELGAPSLHALADETARRSRPTASPWWSPIRTTRRSASARSCRGCPASRSCTSRTARRASDGAAQAHGFATPEAYAAARREELRGRRGARRRAARRARQPRRRRPGSRASSRRARAIAWRSSVRERRIEVVLTHAYRRRPSRPRRRRLRRARGGGAARGADGPRPAVVEMPFYHAGPSGWTVQRFLAAPARPELAIASTTSQRRRKQAHARRPCQPAAGPGAWSPSTSERFRPAPAYDFTALPNGGRLLYERYGWGIDGRALAGPRGGGACATSASEPSCDPDRSSASPIRWRRSGRTRSAAPSRSSTQLDGALVRPAIARSSSRSEGSRIAGTLVAGPGADAASRRRAPSERAWARHRAAIAAALRRWPVDVVHLHGVDFHAYLPPPGVPALATLHLPPVLVPARGPCGRRGPTPGSTASARRSTRPARQSPNLLPPIENGVPVEALAARHAKRRFALIARPHLPRKGRASRDRGGEAGRHPAPRRRRGFPLRVPPALLRRGGPAAPRPRGAASSARSASRASAGCSRRRAASSCRPSRPRPARSSPARRSPAARRSSPFRTAPCRRRSSTAAPAFLVDDVDEMAEAIAPRRTPRPGGLPEGGARALLARRA